MNPDWRSRYEVAIEAAREAGQLALKYFTGAVTVEWKPDQSPVTVADREAEGILRKVFLSRFPKDGFLGEESGQRLAAAVFAGLSIPLMARATLSVACRCGGR